MKFGLCYFPTDYSTPPDKVALEAEKRGFESLLFPEHTHIPVSRKTEWSRGGDVPKEYIHSFDPFVALGSAASVTDKILLGTGICLVIERDPIILAKEIATLDFISNGRVLFGVGGGWNKEEMKNHGTDYPVRWKILKERIEAMKEIWLEDEASYHGEFVRFDEIWSWPKPKQEPHPPILIGGDADRTFQRVLSYGDAWMPYPKKGDSFSEKIKKLNDMASDEGRGSIPVTMFGVAYDPKIVEGFINDGADRILFWLPSEGEKQVLGTMDSLVSIMEKF